VIKKLRSRKPKRTPPGSAPGEISTNPAAAPTTMRLFAYNASSFEETVLENVSQLKEYLSPGRWPVVWLDVDGLGSVEKLQEIGEAAGLHRLSLADVANAYQRPKVEDFGSYILLVTRAPFKVGPSVGRAASTVGEAGGAIPGEGHVAGVMGLETEQISIYLGAGFIITFQEAAKPGDCFGGVRERIRKASAGMRTRGADYLMYALLDSVIDAYFPVLEELGERLNEIEDMTLNGTDMATMRQLHIMRREFLTVRRAAWPLREAVGSLNRDSTPLITEQTRVYIRDCYDHTVQILDFVETSRELSAGLMELHMTAASYRLNEVMKVLTIITTIFIPLSFIAGIYGMNFQTDKPGNMPELALPYAYPVVLAFMAVIGLIMLWIFWRRGWIGPQRVRREKET